jgi:hypothetical protein
MTSDQRDEAFFADDSEHTLPEPSSTEGRAPVVETKLPQPEVG